MAAKSSRKTIMGVMGSILAVLLAVAGFLLWQVIEQKSVDFGPAREVVAEMDEAYGLFEDAVAGIDDANLDLTDGARHLANLRTARANVAFFIEDLWQMDSIRNDERASELLAEVRAVTVEFNASATILDEVYADVLPLVWEFVDAVSTEELDVEVLELLQGVLAEMDELSTEVNQIFVEAFGEIVNSAVRMAEIMTICTETPRLCDAEVLEMWDEEAVLIELDGMVEQWLMEVGGMMTSSMRGPINALREYLDGKP